VNGAWHGYHLIVEDRIEYPREYISVAVANVDFFGRGLLVGFQGSNLEAQSSNLGGEGGGGEGGGGEGGGGEGGGGEGGGEWRWVPSKTVAPWTDVLQLGFIAFHSSVHAAGIRLTPHPSPLTPHPSPLTPTPRDCAIWRLVGIFSFDDLSLQFAVHLHRSKLVRATASGP
jgi:hypothetical protein